MGMRTIFERDSGGFRSEHTTRCRRKRDNVSLSQNAIVSWRQQPTLDL